MVTPAREPTHARDPLMPEMKEILLHSIMRYIQLFDRFLNASVLDMMLNGPMVRSQ